MRVRPFGGRHLAGDFPTQQRVSAAIGQPGAVGLLVCAGQRLQHHIFMIAHEIDDPRHRHGRPPAQPVHHLCAVQPTIDVVAQMNQDGIVDGPSGEVLGDLLMHRGETIQAPMNVADGIDALARREGSWGGDEIDHGALPLKQKLARDATIPRL